MAGLEYPKVDTLYNRDDHKLVIVGELRRPEFGNIKIWSLTEKINGENIRATLFDTGDIKYGGRTDDAELRQDLLEYMKRTFTPEKMKAIFWIDPLKIPTSATVYCEGYGPKMAHGSGVYRTDISSRLFDCLVVNETGRWWLERINIEDVAGKLGIKCVPILGTIDFLPVNPEEIKNIFLKFSKSLVAIEENGNKDAIPEGIIARTKPLLFNNKGERVMWKLKIKDFKK